MCVYFGQLVSKLSEFRTNNMHKFTNTANALELIEKYFLDLRNTFLNQENIRNFSQNRKIHLAEKNFLVLSVRKFILIFLK